MANRLKASYRVVDRGWNQIRKTMNTIRNHESYVKAGVLADATPRVEGQITNVELALIHEFGSPSRGIPERSWIRSAFEIGRDDYVKLLRLLLDKVFANQMTVEKALGILGVRMAADMKRRVKGGAGIPPPLKPATVRRKGSSRPLIDTAQMVNSVSHKVVLSERNGAAE